MRLLALFALVHLTLPSLVLAGQINGTIRQEGQPMRNVRIVIECPQGAHEGSTNSRGAYSIYVSGTDRCTFVLPDLSGTRQAIYSYRDPVRYDFDVVRQGSSHVLRKR